MWIYTRKLLTSVITNRCVRLSCIGVFSEALTRQLIAKAHRTKTASFSFKYSSSVSILVAWVLTAFCRGCLIIL